MPINHMYIKKAVAPAFLRVLSRFVQLRCSDHKTAGGGSCILNLSFFFSSSFLSLCCRRARWARLPDHNTQVQPALTPQVTATRP